MEMEALIMKQEVIQDLRDPLGQGRLPRDRLVQDLLAHNRLLWKPGKLSTETHPRGHKE